MLYIFLGYFKLSDNIYDGGIFLLIDCFKVCHDLEFKKEQKKEAESHKYILQLEKTEEPHRKTKLTQHRLSFWLSSVQ